MKNLFKLIFVALILSTTFIFSGAYVFPKAKAITQATNPTPAEAMVNPIDIAGGLVSVAQLILNGNAFNSVTWGANSLIMIPLDVVTRLLFGDSIGVDAIFVDKVDPVPVNLDQRLTDSQNPSWVFNGGFIGLSATLIDSAVTDPPIPTNMALYINDTFSNTIFGTPAFAQTSYSNPSNFFQSTTFLLWKYSRDIALAIVGLLLAVAAIGIMFRQKINPQMSVTVSSVLPYVPISLLGIVLSYPLVALALNAVFPLAQIAMNIGISFIGDVFADSVSWVTDGVSMYEVLSFGVKAAVTIVTHGIIGIPLIGFVLIAAIVMFISFFRFVIEIAKTMAMFMFYVIVFPLVSAIAILPSKQKLILILVKKILANMLVIPVITLMFLVGMGIIATISNSELDPLSGGYAGATFWFFGELLVAAIKFFIGITIIWQSFKARQILENLLGTKESIFNLAQGVEQRR